MNLSTMLASFGIGLAVFSMLFILISNFGCQPGNVGAAGLTGSPGTVGSAGQSGILTFSPGVNVVPQNLAGTGVDQLPAFQGSLLLRDRQNFAVSQWVVSTIAPTAGDLTLEFVLVSDALVVPLTPSGPIVVSFTGLPIAVRHEVKVDLFLWRISDISLEIVVAGQTVPFMASVFGFDTAMLSMRCTSTVGYGVTTGNTIVVYAATAEP